MSKQEIMYEHVERWKQSGLTQSEYCVSVGIELSALFKLVSLLHEILLVIINFLCIYAVRLNNKIMKVVDLKLDSLNLIQKKAIAKAVEENRALNLSYTIVEENMLIEVDGLGNRKILRKSKFATIKSTYGKRVLTLKK